MTQENNLVTLKEFALLKGKSESRIRAILRVTRNNFPKAVEHGKYVSGGRIASRYTLESLESWYLEYRNSVKAKKDIKTPWRNSL